MQALISVSDKTSIVELAQAFHDLGIGLISTGGTTRRYQPNAKIMKGLG